MNKYSIACIAVVMALLCGCVSTEQTRKAPSADGYSAQLRAATAPGQRFQHGPGGHRSDREVILRGEFGESLKRIEVWRGSYLRGLRLTLYNSDGSTKEQQLWAGDISGNASESWSFNRNDAILRIEALHDGDGVKALRVAYARMTRTAPYRMMSRPRTKQTDGWGGFKPNIHFEAFMEAPIPYPFYEYTGVYGWYDNGAKRFTAIGGAGAVTGKYLTDPGSTQSVPDYLSMGPIGCPAKAVPVSTNDSNEAANANGQTWIEARAEALDDTPDDIRSGDSVRRYVVWRDEDRKVIMGIKTVTWNGSQWMSGKQVGTPKTFEVPNRESVFCEVRVEVHQQDKPHLRLIEFTHGRTRNQDGDLQGKQGTLRQFEPLAPGNHWDFVASAPTDSALIPYTELGRLGIVHTGNGVCGVSVSTRPSERYRWQP